jgi:hypothetical protein
LGSHDLKLMSWRFAAATVSASASQRQSLVDVVTAAMMPPGLSKLQQKSWEKKQIKLRRQVAEMSAEEDAPEGTQIHVRGVGVHGWDGTPNGEGEFESEDALGKIFSAFGVFVQATVRHRIDAGTGENTSWALVTMGDTAAADRALGAPVVMAGSHPLMLTAFSRKQANASTGQMGAVQASDRKKKKKKSAALFFAENPELAVPIAVSSAATPRKKKRAAGARPESGSCNLHVRGVESTSEDALAALFARHGECVQVTVRRREDAEGKDTSWALVTMGSHRAAEAAFMATVVVSFSPPGPAV